ncbi:MAG TPA: carbonic anhydrase family protein [Nitrospirales bacterium]|nr:carbonic anhydrase family protein [Nitrospirales bacterium]
MCRKNQVHISFRVQVHGALLICALMMMVGQVSAEGAAASAHVDPPTTSHQAHWDYMGIDGPDHWGMLEAGYMVCEKGREQSPIDVKTSQDLESQSSLVFHYQSSPVHIVNNGHTVQVNYKAGSVVQFNGQEYELRQFHFHDPSEHHIDGKSFPGEMHLVHQSRSGHLLVIGVLIQIGEQHPLLDQAGKWVEQKLGHRIPIEGEDIRSGLVLNVKDLLPNDTNHFYSYHGSLTTPPCSEGVQWIILKEHIEVSEQQIQRFVRTIGSNARPIQLPSGRLIEAR